MLGSLSSWGIRSVFLADGDPGPQSHPLHTPCLQTSHYASEPRFPLLNNEDQTLAHKYFIIFGIIHLLTTKIPVRILFLIWQSSWCFSSFCYLFPAHLWSLPLICRFFPRGRVVADGNVTYWCLREIWQMLLFLSLVFCRHWNSDE